MKAILKTRVVGTTRQAVIDGYKEGAAQGADESLFEGIAGGIVDSLLMIHADKITAALRRAGLDVEDGQVISTEAILDMVNKKTGLELNSFDPDEIADAVAKKLSTDVSQQIGFEVDLSNGLDAAVDGVIQDAMTGRANVLVGRVMASRLRAAAIAAAAGVDVEDVRRLKRNANQRRYNHSVQFVWVAR